MAILLGLLLFALPFLLYALWWRHSGRSLEAGPPRLALVLGGVALLLALGAAVHYGLSRSMERGERYVPARIEGGEIRR